MIKFKQDEIIILLGAGASVDAGIPHSRAMVDEIQSLVDGDDEEWQKYRNLYRYLRSAVYYADGLRGLFGNQVLFNIERVVNTLEELDKKESHPLYPFVGAWNPKLVDVAGHDFEYVSSFRKVNGLNWKWLRELPTFRHSSISMKNTNIQFEFSLSTMIYVLKKHVEWIKCSADLKIVTGIGGFSMNPATIRSLSNCTNCMVLPIGSLSTGELLTSIVHQKSALTTLRLSLEHPTNFNMLIHSYSLHMSFGDGHSMRRD